MELFLNPWSMILGGLLISAPIIIHLINRIRYKRVEWAAMEFLLEAMKRNKRKLILEQLLLLLLRIFLVLLTGFWSHALWARRWGVVRALLVSTIYYWMIH